jgi:glycosyltransferase involved in cell wall biosynthesis
MSERPLVSVVLRTYERPTLLRRAIESVLDQTYERFELLVLDDHSEDETPRVVREYAEADDRIRYVRNEENLGHVTTLNKGVRLASGTYVAFLDDDDVWLPRKLERQVETFESLGEEYGLVTGGVRVYDLDSGDLVRTQRLDREGYIFEDLLRHGSGSLLGPPSVVVLRRSVFDDLGYFDEDQSRGSGQKYFRRLARTYKIAGVDEPCIEYYVHEDRITTLDQESLAEAIRLQREKIDRLRDDLVDLPAAYARELETLGNLYCVAGDTAEGRRWFLRAVRDGDPSTAVFVRIVLSLFGRRVYGHFFSPGFRYRPQLERVKRVLGRLRNA